VSSSRFTGAALGGLVLALAACAPIDEGSGSAAPISAPAAPSVATPVPVTAPVDAPPEPLGDTVTVTRVVDGDTFEVTGGRTIRVLGIDSCEADTDAGPDATAAAESLLLAGPVLLTAEPGVDLDRYGRELRYVRLADSADFGLAMVPAPHTGVYEGGDASPQYVEQLRSADDGRDCDGPDPVVVPPPAEEEESDDSGSSGAAYYPNCSSARAAGAAPLYAGEPGYSSDLDRDGDGVACES